MVGTRTCKHVLPNYVYNTRWTKHCSRHFIQYRLYSLLFLLTNQTAKEGCTDGGMLTIMANLGSMYLYPCLGMVVLYYGTSYTAVSCAIQLARHTGWCLYTHTCHVHNVHCMYTIYMYLTLHVHAP